MIPDGRFKLKNRHWWSLGKPYRRCNYDVKVVIGPADVRFQLWFEGTMVIAGNPITVQWEASAAPPPPIGSDGEARGGGPNRSGVADDLPAVRAWRRSADAAASAAVNAVNAAANAAVAAAAAMRRGEGLPNEDPAGRRVNGMGGPPPPHHYGPNGNAH
jgi:hypothetical protein